MVAGRLAPLGQMVRVGRGLAWAAFVVAFAICSTGLILALDHPQTGSGRPELTARGDSIAEPRLDAMTPDLTRLSTAAEQLAGHARDTFSDLKAQDTDAVRSDLAAGDGSLTDITLAAAAIQAARNDLGTATGDAPLSTANRTRIAALDAALSAAGAMPSGWAHVADAAVVPVNVLEGLAHHDQLVLDATAAARSNDFATALQRLSDAGTALEAVKTLAIGASEKGLDVQTLGSWIGRSERYDVALKSLYSILVQTGGTMTGAASVALQKVNAAKAALPANTSALVIIVSDLGGQQITAGLIEIDQDRGDIDAALPAEP
jgi:hypothetical protein